jgi:hypothetical protein
MAAVKVVGFAEMRHCKMVSQWTPVSGENFIDERELRERGFTAP